eukprot:493653-Pelagomonas_calceolata.AAC.9
MLLAECAEMKLGGGGLAHRFTLTSIPGTFGLSSSAACSISRFTGLLNPRMIRASAGKVCKRQQALGKECHNEATRKGHVGAMYSGEEEADVNL